MDGNYFLPYNFESVCVFVFWHVNLRSINHLKLESSLNNHPWSNSPSIFSKDNKKLWNRYQYQIQDGFLNLEWHILPLFINLLKSEMLQIESWKEI